jgi:hypothetical protein
MTMVSAAEVYLRFHQSLRLPDKAEVENMTENGVDQVIWTQNAFHHNAC